MLFARSQQFYQFLDFLWKSFRVLVGTVLGGVFSYGELHAQLDDFLEYLHENRLFVIDEWILRVDELGTVSRFVNSAVFDLRKEWLYKQKYESNFSLFITTVDHKVSETGY